MKTITSNPDDNDPKKQQHLSQKMIDDLMNNPLIPKETMEVYRGELALHRILTSDPKMIALKDRIRKHRDRSESILILGETGTGKDLIARALHGNRKGKILHVNCSGLPDELLESELFGHTKGSFTGAIADREGKFVAAKDGTIFLDEIGDMRFNMQAKLLIALQDNIITPLGSNQEIPVNCRVIAATNKDLKKMIDLEQFRRDLYHRIATFTFRTIPLRERRDDIDEAMDSLYDTEGKIPLEVREKIHNMALLGNYRELRTICLGYIVDGELPKEDVLL